MPRSPSATLPLAPGLLESVEREVVREMGRDAYVRRVLYLGGPGGLGAPEESLSGLDLPARSSPVGARIYLFGPAGAPARAHPLVTRVPVSGDRRLAEHAFLLYLSQRAAYALLRGPGGRIFHTADAPLVEALAAKLHRRYDLEPL